MPSDRSVTARRFFNLSVPELLDGGIVGGTLDTAIPAAVVIRAVTIALTVRLVVLALVGDEIVQREAVVARHEVDALLRLALLVAEDLGAADQPVGEAGCRSRIAPEEAASIVAESSVPFLPAVADEAADLVKSCGVPRLGDHLRVGQHGV
jgi:hypothetical protein